MNRSESIAQLESEGLVVTEWHDDPSTFYPEHAHPHREVRIVLDGAMTMHVGGRERLLGPGDRIDLSAGEPHAARVGSDGVSYLAGTER